MSRNNVWGLWAGGALIGLGLIFLLGQLLHFDVMRYLWPAIIIAVGAALFAAMLAGGRAMGTLAVPGSVITTIGLILFVQNLFGIWSTWAYAWALIIAGAGVGLVIFGWWSQLPDLARAGRVVASIGLILFFAFGLFFELGASLLGMRSPGGVLWAILLILAGLYVLFRRTLFGRWTETGPVSRSTVNFSAAPDSPASASTEANAAANTGAASIGAAANVGAAAASVDSGPFPSTVSATSTAMPAGIRRVRFRALGDLTIVQSEQESLEIEAHQAVRERIRTEVRGDILEIRYEQNWLDWLQPRFWNISSPLRFTLSLRDLDLLDSGGLGNLVVNGLAANHFELAHSGAGNITIRGFAGESLRVTQAGLGDIEIEGRVNRQEVDLSGTGSYRAGRLQSEQAAVRLSGLGSAIVWARSTLDARISGAGSIEYYGSAQLTQHVSGLGSIRRMGER